MSQVSITAPTSVNQGNYMNLQINPKAQLPAVAKIDAELNARGRTEIADESYQAALRNLQKMFDTNNKQVSIDFEANKGIQGVTITDTDTGKPIAKLPPDAVIVMANRARERTYGLLLDKMA